MSVDVSAIQSDYELSENVAEDVVEYSRGNIIKNEQQAQLLLYGWLTGWMAKSSRYVSVVNIGTSSSGKTHLMKNMRKVLPSNLRYEGTAGSDKSFIDDDDWEGTLVATLEEWNQLSGDLKEFMKKVAGGDTGFQYARNQRDDSSKTGFSPEKWERKPKPYSFQYAQFTMDFEMWNRLFKNYVDESTPVHEAIGMKEHDHTHIDMDGLFKHEYIYPTHDVHMALKEHISSLPRNTYTYIPEWIWYADKPIFQHGRSEVNRIYSMITGFMRSSALLNHENRRTTTIKNDNGDEVEAIVVHPQDVANVLSCREVILGTTHELEPRKLTILRAIEKTGGFEERSGISGATLDDIHAFMESGQTEMTRLKKDQLREILKELDENYYVKRHEGMAENGADLYETGNLADIGVPRLTGFGNEYFEEGVTEGYDLQDPFEDTKDPIRDIPFKESVKRFRDEFMEVEEDASDIARESSEAKMRSSNTNGTSSGQTSLTGASDASQNSQDDVELSPTEKSVYVRLIRFSDGETFDWEDKKAEHLVGAVDVDEDFVEADVSGTILDPDSDVWERDDRPDGWVKDENSALSKVKSALKSLRRKGVYTFEVVEGSEEEPEKIKVDVEEIDV